MEHCHAGYFNPIVDASQQEFCFVCFYFSIKFRFDNYLRIFAPANSNQFLLFTYLRIWLLKPALRNTRSSFIMSGFVHTPVHNAFNERRKCLSYLLNKITIVFEAQKIKQIPLTQMAAMIGSGILVKMRLGGTWLYPTGVTLRDSTGGWSVNTGVSVGTGGNCPYTMESVIALHTSKKWNQASFSSNLSNSYLVIPNFEEMVKLNCRPYFLHQQKLKIFMQLKRKEENH